MTATGPIGIFDSGYGGLTVLDSIRSRLPEYDYLYLGDNARAPYGGRSFEVVYQFTRQAVLRLFEMGCHLVILGCNTASAKALRTIQQHDLPLLSESNSAENFQLSTFNSQLPRRVLGVIRPTAEIIGQKTKTRHVGLLATEGTVRSESYQLEIQKFFPDIQLTSVACPLWAAIVEAGEADSSGADYFVKKRIDQLMGQDPKIDAVILGCTHYPLLLPKIKNHIPDGVEIISQGHYVAESLENYLQRHPEIEKHCTKNGQTRYFTTENPEKFQESARIFLQQKIFAQHIDLQ
ncbi:MAG: aspartate/glutamate racemase family protein [Prevotella sp.]|nr:aspartate/glutamate racemase family protein [Prevotella sp.]MBR7086284.1 aspartate/glutamate racemase family protein [Prevotella sp.]